MATPKYTLELPEGKVELDTDLTYHVYGEPTAAQQLAGMKFEHLSWLDQLVLVNELQRTNEVSIMFHPEVTRSLISEQEASPYWGKDKFEVEAQFRRTNTKTVTDEKLERKLTKPIEWTPTMHSKKGKVVGRLVEMGYDRLFTRDIVKEFLEVKGEKYMNLTVNQIADMVDEFARNTTPDSTGNIVDQTKIKHISDKRSEVVTCPHCGKEGRAAGMKANHFGNCKVLKGEG